ncbi:MAG: hypothetical protein HQM12_02095 [SAR324 cluster bacterium]|nr:hypothetical protein [SAR324 cluster bacterium]
MSTHKRVIFANLIDANGDGAIDMVSFLDEKGSIGLAVDSTGNGKIDKVYVFQDVTGDGKMDSDDEVLLLNKANELVADTANPQNPRLISF